MVGGGCASCMPRFKAAHLGKRNGWGHQLLVPPLKRLHGIQIKKGAVGGGGHRGCGVLHGESGIQAEQREYRMFSFLF